MLLSLMTLYHNDTDLFQPLQVPAGIDKAQLVNYILLHTAELEILYPDPAIFKIALQAWTAARLPSWQKMVTALNKNYDPLNNYDRTEIETIDRDTTKAVEDERTGSTSSTVTNSATASNTGSITDQVSGFNATTWANKEKTDETGSSQTSGTTTGSGSSSDTGESSETGTEDVERNFRAYGNIGVTTSQEMLQAELEIRQTDFFQIFLREFKRQFCLLIY